ncbi:MAG: diadenylate cyclase [Desulfobacteraceae bacterium]|jgi:diadenylate cyclase|nr:diadenylate cyclase [Desulfobacteraceae bacterium]
MILLRALLDWRTVIDITLIATCLFFLYQTINRLGTWKIVVGILAAMMIFLGANIFDLAGIEWIYRNLSSVVIIALIIIFQPELRKIFERAVSVRRNEIFDNGNDLSNMIAQALSAMAQQRCGAILVFPGKESITEYVSGGFSLDAKPSYPLLMSIFDHNSPGHDGAIIITGGQFTQFGVRLPISESLKLPREYGTRHHAALGLAEKTDSLVFVVSEERGNVSVFHMGKMIKADSQKAIISTIASHWENTSSYPLDFLKNKNRWTVFYQMAASLALALLFWSTIIVAQGERIERVFTVPVEYLASPTSLALVGEREKEVQLYLGGTKSDLDAIVNPSDLSVKIDLSKVALGTQSFFITNDDIRLPKGVKLIEATPSRIELTFAAITEHWAFVVPQLVGDLPSGLTIGSVVVKPDKVKVISPSSDGDGKTVNVTTTPIYMESITKNRNILCKIIAPQTIQPVDKRWPDVEVIISINRQVN